MIRNFFLGDTEDAEEKKNGVASVEAVTMEMDEGSTLRWDTILFIEPDVTLWLYKALDLVPICIPHYKTLSWKASECADSECKTDKFVNCLHILFKHKITYVHWSQFHS